MNRCVMLAGKLFPVLFSLEAASESVLDALFSLCARRGHRRLEARPLFEALLLACLGRLVRHAILLLADHHHEVFGRNGPGT